MSWNDESIVLTTEEDDAWEPKHTDEQPPQMGRALAYIGLRELRALLDLPPDVEIGGIFDSPERAAIGIHLRGPNLPPCEDGCIPERVSTRAVYRGTWGHVLQRIEFILPISR